MRKLILTVALLPATALASADSVPNVNPRNLGMAGSIVAAEEGAPAVFGNPAALSRVRGLDVSLAGSLIDNSTTWTTTTPAYAPSPVSTNFKPAYPPSIQVAYGGTMGERGWGVGLGMGIPEGGNVDWPAAWPGRFEVITVDRKVFGFYLTGGFEIIPQIRVGAGAVYYRTTEYLTQAVDFVGTEGMAYVSTAGGSWSYDVSAEVKPFLDVPLTFGVDFKGASSQSLTGDARFTGVPPALRSSLPDQGVTHDFTVPYSLNVGAAYRPIPKLLLAFTWTQDGFSSYKEDKFVGDFTLPDGSHFSVTVPRNYGNGNVFRLGGEYTLSPEWQVRAGVLNDQTGMQVQYFSPSLPDGDVWAGALGGSWFFAKGWGVHGAVFYAHYADVDTTGQPPAFPGTWQSQAWIYSLGFTWRQAP
jgi:long-chain fatty acid transport protein